MSWDLIVQNFQGNPPSDDDLGAEPEPLGTAASIRKRIDTHLPGVVWSDSLHGLFERQGVSIEFEISNDKPITAVVLSVRGTGDAYAALKSFAVPNQWSLFDCSESSFIDLDTVAATGFEEFQEYRDRVIPTKRKKTSKKKSASKARGTATSKDAVSASRKRKPKKG
jgi:hypothetical protein